MINIESSKEVWDEFLKRYYWEQILELAHDYPECKSLWVEFSNLEKYNMDVARELLDSPDAVLGHATESLKAMDLPADVDFTESHVRVRHLPELTLIKDIRSVHINTLIAVTGLVRKATEVRPRIVNAAFRCARCEDITYLPQEEHYVEPFECDNEVCGRKGPFKLVREESEFIDFQKIRIQDSPDEVRPGEQPQTLDAIVTEDLTGRVSPGDRVVLVGVLRSYQRATQQGKSTAFDLLLDTVSVEIEEKGFEEIEVTKEDERKIQELGKDPAIYGKILGSIAPSIYGYEEVKEAMALQLFAGLPKELPDGLRIRGDIHVLLVGDPGVAKSQCLRYSRKLAPRGVFTSGRGSTSAGLTATAVKDNEFSNGRWTLEAGALVLADMGLACIEANQRVITADGIRAIRDIKVGDRVVNFDGGFHIATVARVIDNGLRNTIKISLYTGDVLECTPDHKLLTRAGWKEAGALTAKDYLVMPADYSPVRVADTEAFEKGLIHGFALCDVYINELSPKNGLGFSASDKNEGRTKILLSLVEKHYRAHFTRTSRSATVQNINGHHASFSSTTGYSFTSKDLKSSILDLFQSNSIRLSNTDFCVGFIAGILSTDCCISHKRGTHGVKHVIEIGLGRDKYDDEWLADKMKLINAIFHRFGILSIARKRKLVISSLDSYNRVVDIFSQHVVGANRQKLYRVEPRCNVASFDQFLDDGYLQWFKSVKFNTSKTVELGLHSRIYSAIKKGRITVGLMSTLREHWSSITAIEFREPNKNYLLNKVIEVSPGSLQHVYDLTIEGEHNFLVSGAIVKNCVDELDKMEADDRSSIHEAMEQQTVTINKAGINTMLRARCAVLGAANPKFGRFDRYEPIGKQINLPPTLLSRFDLIFVILDEPTAFRDTAVSNHIFNTHIAGELSLRRKNVKNSGITVEQVAGAMSDIQPILDAELLRKYIAYAKRNAYPIVQPDARQRLTDFYLSLRKLGEDPNAPLPVTARQLEALIRLAEASARTRLSGEAAIGDAERVIRIVTASLNQVIKDPDTGKLDSDIINAGMGKSQRDRIKLIREAIRTLQGSNGNDVPMDLILQTLEKEGLKKEFVEDAVARLKTAGELIETSSRRYRTV